MTLVEQSPLKIRTVSRRELAAERARTARESLLRCHLCAHHCGVNRLRGEHGLCHADATPRVFSAQVEVSDELEFIPTFAIALSGCDLRCSFCITGKESWNPTAGEILDVQALADAAVDALEHGARTIMLLGGEPTIHLPTALQLAALLPDDAQLIWKTNAHGSPQSRELLDGIFDIWLADYKFGNDDCAARLAGIANYTAIVRENLLWANEHSDLVVRHLVMPGHVDCCWAPIAEWIATNLPNVRVNLRSGFWPAWHAHKHSELRGTVTATDFNRALSIARDLNLCLIE